MNEINVAISNIPHTFSTDRMLSISPMRGLTFEGEGSLWIPISNMYFERGDLELRKRVLYADDDPGGWGGQVYTV